LPPLISTVSRPAALVEVAAVAGVPDHPVGSRLAKNLVVAGAAGQNVVAGAAEQKVDPAFAKQRSFLLVEEQISGGA
jgi:hypothetical protein